MSGDERHGGLAVWWGDPAVTGSPSRGSFVLPAGTVGFLLTDVEGSTHLWEADAEAMAAVMARHAQILDHAVSAHGGVCPPAQGEGDSVVAAFARASDAVVAARDAQRALVAEAWPATAPLRVRMAVHAGEARVVDDGNYAGQAIIRAARLRAIAHGVQVLVSAAARDLTVDQLGDSVGFADVGEHRLKDLARPEHVYQLLDGALPSVFPSLRSLDAHAHNLPTQLSSFIGRAHDIATVVDLLATHRLVTVTGAGGAGKTRLALQAAAEVVERYGDGVWWVELAEMTDPDLIAATVAAAVGVKADVGEQASTMLAERLAGKRLLVVLDNCEHLVAGVAGLVDRVLRRAGGVAVLATSREPLEVAGEVAWRIPPLAVPHVGDHATAIEALSQFDGVRLFVDRARQARPNFHLSNANAPAVAGICERLDGIPLALELAAARCRSLSPAQILDGLADAFRLLTGGGRAVLARQQTLEASIAWSHNLLSSAEQVLLRRLSVFRGGCTLDDAEAVVAGDGLAAGEVLDGLDRLVAQCLVQLDDTDASGVRYRILETVRQYGARHLNAADETAAVRDRHARHYTSIAHRVGPQLEGRDDTAAFARLVADHDNLRAGLDWLAETGRWDDYADAAGCCSLFWVLMAPAEGFARLSRPLTDGILTDPALTARLLCGRAFIESASGRYAEAVADAEVAIALGEQLGDHALVGRATARLGLVISMADPVHAVELLGLAAERCYRDGDLFGAAEARLYRAYAVHNSGRDTQRGWTLLAEARTLTEQCGAHWLLALADSFAGLCAVAHGDFGRALVEAARAEGALRTLAGRARLDVDHFVRVDVVGASVQVLRAMVAVATGEGREVLDWLGGLMSEARADGSPSMARALSIVRALDRAALGDLQGARALLEPVIGAGEAVIWAARAVAADVARAMGDVTAARALLDQAETAAVRGGPYQHFCSTTLSRAALALSAGDLGQAEDLAHEQLSVAHAEQFRIELIICFELLADIATANHGWEHAARLHGAARRLRAETGMTLQLAGYGDVHDRAMAATAEAVGPDAYSAAVAEGAGLDAAAAVVYAQRARVERTQGLPET